jgi:hypothetical protein
MTPAQRAGWAQEVLYPLVGVPTAPPFGYLSKCGVHRENPYVSKQDWLSLLSGIRSAGDG